MSLVRILFLLSEFTSARNVEFLVFDCRDKKRKMSVVRESFNIYKGTEELNVNISLKEKETLFLDIDDDIIENESIQRFKAYHGPEGSYDYISDYFVGDNIIYSSTVPTLVTFYNTIRLLTNDMSFKKGIDYEYQREKANNFGTDERDTRYIEWMEKLYNTLLITKYCDCDNKEEFFSVFKDNLISLLELIFDKDVYQDFYNKIRSLKNSEIYSVEEDVYRKIKRMNEILLKRSYFKKNTKDHILEELIKSPSVWRY